MPADPEQIAAWENHLAAALADHEDAELALIAAKAQCDEACVVAQAAVIADPSEDNRFAEEAVHEPHRVALESAFARFGRVAYAELNLRRAHYGLPPRGSNPAAPGGITEISADISAGADLAAQ